MSALDRIIFNSSEWAYRNNVRYLELDGNTPDKVPAIAKDIQQRARKSEERRKRLRMDQALGNRREDTPKPRQA